MEIFLLYTALEVRGDILRGPRAPPHTHSTRTRGALCLSLGEMGTQKGEKGNFGSCGSQITEEMKLSLCKGGCNPPAFLLTASGMLQMLAETGQDEFKWKHGSLKALFNPVSPHGSAPGRVGFPTLLILLRVGEGENTSPLREEKALCGFPGAFERAPGAEGPYVLVSRFRGDEERGSNAGSPGAEPEPAAAAPRGPATCRALD